MRDVEVERVRAEVVMRLSSRLVSAERQRDDALAALEEIEYLADTGTPLTDILLYTREVRQRIEGGHQ